MRLEVRGRRHESKEWKSENQRKKSNTEIRKVRIVQKTKTATSLVAFQVSASDLFPNGTMVSANS